MKFILLILLIVALSGCAGKKLMKNCHPIGDNLKGDQLSECDPL